ncbi:hypothetical protein [Pontibacter fetidus]|uniref:Uncharacterized protein n=1 Tax=Pontibacter fetidus TaxID=2700082 RepID=A0A6B2H0J8_9BACT|nr:hypothetical protein [Pontibacter fetidus]NDK56789.1 hypothetical protein [Pontibacter fetidus]
MTEESAYPIQLLPYRYKKYGVWVLIAGLPVVGALVYMLVKTGVVSDTRSFFDAWNETMVYYPIITGMALLVFSKEKQEDEMVQHLRYKAFVSGVFFLVMAILWLPVFSIIVAAVSGNSVKTPDVGGMLGALLLLLLYTYISFKYNLHRTRKALDTDEE